MGRALCRESGRATALTGHDIGAHVGVGRRAASAAHNQKYGRGPGRGAGQPAVPSRGAK